MRAHVDYMSELAYHELMAITSVKLTICEHSLTIDKGRNLPEDTCERSLPVSGSLALRM